MNERQVVQRMNTEFRPDRNEHGYLAGMAERFVTKSTPPTCRSFNAKDVIYHEGDTVNGLFQLRGGLIKLISYLSNGRVRIVRLCGKDDLLGLEGLLGQPYRHTAIAVSKVEIACLHANRLQSLERENPSSYCDLLRKGFDQLTASDRWLADFSTGNVKSRIARLLEFLANLKFGEASTTVDLLTVADMADILGVTAESVSRVLAEFKRMRILQPTGVAARERYRIDFPRLRQEAC